MTKFNIHGLLLPGLVLCAGIMPFNTSAGKSCGVLKLVTGGALVVPAAAGIAFGIRTILEAIANKHRDKPSWLSRVAAKISPEMRERLQRAESDRIEAFCAGIGIVIISSFMASSARGLINSGIRDL